MKPYRLSQEAQDDLDDIADFIMRRASAERAVKVVCEIRDECRKIGQWPGMGHFRGEIGDKRIKFLVDLFVSDCLPLEVEARRNHSHCPRSTGSGGIL